MCSNHHFDFGNQIEWGHDIFNHMEAPHNEINEDFNSGYRTLVDWDQVNCPCGKRITESNTSAMCGTCGSITCSSECHHKYI